jgi:hypothetical protein
VQVAVITASVRNDLGVGETLMTGILGGLIPEPPWPPLSDGSLRWRV